MSRHSYFNLWGGGTLHVDLADEGGIEQPGEKARHRKGD
jgi:hypothetical protein